MKNYTWKTKSGEEIPVKNMSRIHLLNTRRYLGEKVHYDEDKLPPIYHAMKLELFFRDHEELREPFEILDQIEQAEKRVREERSELDLAAMCDVDNFGGQS
jgi:hypothetical protein